MYLALQFMSLLALKAFEYYSSPEMNAKPSRVIPV